MKIRLFTISLLLFLYNVASYQIIAQTDKPVLKLEDIFKNNIYKDNGYGPVRWSKDSKGYLTFESNEEVGGRDIVMYDAKTGVRKIVCSAKSFIPEGKTKPCNCFRLYMVG